MTDPPISELDFLRKLQRLLNEGDFTATYKFALLNALADLSVEGETAADGSLRLSLDAIAEAGRPVSKTIPHRIGGLRDS